MLRITREIPRRITYNRDSKDFSVYVDDKHIADVRTYLEGETLANETVYEWLRSGIISTDDCPSRRYTRTRPSLYRVNTCSWATTSYMRWNYIYDRRRVAA